MLEVCTNSIENLQSTYGIKVPQPKRRFKPNKARISMYSKKFVSEYQTSEPKMNESSSSNMHADFPSITGNNIIINDS